MANAQAVLDSSATVLVGMEKAPRSGYATNRGGVASRWLWLVLEMDLENPGGLWP